MKTTCKTCGSTNTYQDLCFDCSKNTPYRKTIKGKMVQVNATAKKQIAKRDGITVPNVPTDITSTYLVNLFNQTKTCIYCSVSLIDFGRKKNSKACDHIIAISKGGQHVKTNVHFICEKCNMIKRNLLEIDFINTKLQNLLNIDISSN